jgi:hypothetical protein
VTRRAAACAGVKVVSLQLSASASTTVVLDSDAGFSRMLKKYNATSLEEVLPDGGAPCSVFTLGALRCGATHRLVPRATPAPARNITLSLELLPALLRDAHDAEEMRFDSLTDGSLAEVLRAAGAVGVAAARDAPVLRHVAQLADGGKYFLVSLAVEASLKANVRAQPRRARHLSC